MPRKAAAVIEQDEEQDDCVISADEDLEGEGTELDDGPDLDSDPADGADKPQQWQPSPPIKPLTPDQLLKQIEELEGYCVKAEARYLDAKSAAKAAKGDYDDAVYRLRQCIVAAANDANRPILQFAEDNASKEPVLPVDGVSDDAKRVLLENLMTPTVAQKLADAGLLTVEDLLEFNESGKKLSDIKGIGPGLAEKIGLRMEDFWQQQAQQEATASD